MVEEFTMMIKDILDKAGLDISLEQIETGLNKMGEEIPGNDPEFEKLLNELDEKYKNMDFSSDEGQSWKGGGDYLAISGLVELEYTGRAHRNYRGRAMLVIKPDDSLIVHGMKGVNPIGYIARADDIRCKGKDGKLTVRAISGSDQLVVTFVKMYAFESLFEKAPAEEASSSPARTKSTDPALTDDEKALEARLRKLRIDLAHRDGITFLPAIYNNKTMRQLVMHKPKSIEELKQIGGFGAKRIERYAVSVLEVINAGTGEGANA